jgi:hypothetical protein
MVRKYQEEVDRLHDTLLSTRENISSMARAVAACELGGRIYEEEFEERHYSAQEDVDGDDRN